MSSNHRVCTRQPFAVELVLHTSDGHVVLDPVTKQQGRGSERAMAESKFDVAIIGAGPAGATAAILLARKDRQVVLIDQERIPRNILCAGWLSALAKPLLDELGCTFPAGCVTPFSDVTFHNADCTKKAQPQLEGPVGYLVDRPQFDAELIRRA